jgi:uncharacterized membrane protein YgcG
MQILNRLALVVGLTATSLVIGLTTGSHPPQAQAQTQDQPQAEIQIQPEHITSFDSQIQINQDGSITITETIDYYTPYDRHGIFRYIPFRYPQKPFVLTAPIRDVSVTDIQEQPIQFEQFKESGNLTLKIGDPDVTFEGPKTYVIQYTVQDAVRQLADGSVDLLWDITGEGWGFPIFQTTATVQTEFATFGEINCYTGAFGGNDSLCGVTAEAGASEAKFNYDQHISYGNNMTVGLVLSADNTLQLPGKWQRQLKFLLDNWLGLVVPLPILIMFWHWYKRGRDFVYYTEQIVPGERKPFQLQPLFSQRRVPFVYEPLVGATPGQAGAIIDESVNDQDVVAEILDLARKKYLRIEGVYDSEKKRQAGQAKDYTFIQLKEADSSLPEHQKYLLEGLFKGGSEKKLSELKGKFATTFQKTKELIYQSAQELTWFTVNAKTAREFGLAKAIILLVVGAAACFAYLEMGGSLVWLELLVIQIPVVLFLGWQMPQKTALGSAMMGQARGLKKSIQYGKWREQIKEKRLFIDEVLPFAVATGVISQLTKDMKALKIPEPAYVAGLAGSNPAAWSNSLSSFSSASTSQLSYSPQSSSYSGGGGGGSSGGGGGGGGGGSW